MTSHGLQYMARKYQQGSMGGQVPHLVDEVECAGTQPELALCPAHSAACCGLPQHPWQMICHTGWYASQACFCTKRPALIDSSAYVRPFVQAANHSQPGASYETHERAARAMLLRTSGAEPWTPKQKRPPLCPQCPGTHGRKGAPTSSTNPQN